LERLLALRNGARVFRYQRDGETFNLTSVVLNEYLGENLGNSFTAKDFRTWGGTLLAAVELARHEPPESESQGKRVVAAVMRKVGDELGNTAAVARASYVSPVVVEHYLAGRTIEDFRPKPGSRTPKLRSDEAALVRMLRSRRV
jgi:DNA topoisomerase I